MLGYDGIKDAMEDIAAMRASAPSPVPPPSAAPPDEVPGSALTRCLMATLPPECAAALEALGTDQKDELGEYEKEASTLVGAFVCLIDGSATEAEVRLSLQNGPSGTAGRHLPALALYDIAAATENSKYPSKSLPPWSKDKCEKMLRAFLDHRQSDEGPTSASASADAKVASLSALLPIDTLMFMDQGRTSFKEAFKNCLRGLPGKLSPLTINIVYPEAAINGRRSEVHGNVNGRGFMTLKQLEQVTVIQSEQYQPPLKRDNLHFTGTTVGDSLLSVGLPPLTDSTAWKVSVGEKLKMLGPDSMYDTAAGRHAEGPAPPRLESSVEPFNFHSRLPMLYAELIHRTDCKVVIDLTASDVNLALTCLLARKPYVGVCHTSEHAKCMNDRLKALVFAKFYETGSPLYKPVLAQLLQGAAPPELPGRRARVGTRAGQNVRRRLNLDEEPLDPDDPDETVLPEPDFEVS